MNRILATILATLNALLGFVLIFGSIWFAKFRYEQNATQQITAIDYGAPEGQYQGLI